MKIKKTVIEDNVPKLIKVLEELGSTKLEVGIFGKDDSEILMIATVNEYGLDIDVTDKMRNYLHSQGLHLKASTKQIHIPERSFMRSFFNENRNKVAGNGEKLLEKVLSLDLPVRIMFEALGEELVGMLQKHLTNVSKPPNHPYTVEQKGSSNPLIDTSRLRSSITYKVIRK